MRYPIQVWLPLVLNHHRTCLVSRIFSEHRISSCADGWPSFKDHHGQGLSPRFVDQYELQLFDAFRILNPGIPKGSEAFEEAWQHYLAQEGGKDHGNWVFYPWLNTCVRVLDEWLFQQVRLSRNMHKISQEEQAVLQKKTVAIIGLSVGQSAAVTLAMEGTASTLRLADFDTLDLSNLNRLRAGVHQIGERKTRLAARAIVEINPYATIELFEEGATPENLKELLFGADVLLEECDALPIKIMARLAAKQLGIPVIMDTSDRGMLDVERFDLEPNRQLFHGLAGEINEATIQSLTPQSALELMMAVVDYPSVSERLKSSYAEMGKTLVSWPQLASEVMAGGAHAAEATRRILLNQAMPSGRYYLELLPENSNR